MLLLRMLHYRHGNRLRQQLTVGLMLVLDARMIPVASRRRCQVYVDARPRGHCAVNALGRRGRRRLDGVRCLVDVTQRLLRLLVMTDELMRMSEMQMIRGADSLMEAGDERLVAAVDWTLDGDWVWPRAWVIRRLQRQRWTVVDRQVARRTIVSVLRGKLLEARGAMARCWRVLHQRR